MNPPMNLNELLLESEYAGKAEKLREQRNAPVTGDDATAYFGEIKEHLVNCVQQYPIVLGCVAWLTDFDILAALAEYPKHVQICVQKEDFLRPDYAVSLDDRKWRSKLRDLYHAMPRSFSDRSYFKPIVSEYNTSCPGECHGIRCVGNHNADKAPAFPRMHNKFLVFADFSVDEYEFGYKADEIDEKYFYEGVVITPKAAWTGSFNFTANAGRSFENALLIKDPKIVEAYYHEWQYILGFSEELNWSDKWTFPEYRIGT